MERSSNEVHMKETAVAAAQLELLDPKLASLAAFREAKTLPFPSYLPMQDHYEASSFYARACYAQYYGYVMDALTANKRLTGFTVMGTPDCMDVSEGVGKSMFMAYVFLRYRQENPDATIMVEAYTDNSTLKEILVWHEGTVYEYASQGNDAAMESIMVKHSGRASLLLIDGIPYTPPDDVERYVVLTSPNEQWNATTWKDPTVRCVYMPVWGMEELLDAAAALGLRQLLEPLSDEEKTLLRLDSSDAQALGDGCVLAARAYVFGRVARGCLATDADTVEKLLGRVEQAISVFIDHVNSSVVSAPTSTDRHLLCHYFLCDPEDFTKCYIKYASPYITRRLRDHMIRLDKAKQQLLEKSLLSDDHYE